MDDISCVSCGKATAKENAVFFGNDAVCFSCKAQYVQCLQEGRSLPSSATVWRDGPYLVIAPRSNAPTRCTGCNCSSGTRRQPLLCDSAADGTKQLLYVSVCETCRKKRSFKATGIILTQIIWAGVIIGVALNQPRITIVASLLALLASFALICLPNKLTFHTTKGGFFYIRGACKAYLGGLPEV